MKKLKNIRSQDPDTFKIGDKVKFKCSNPAHTETGTIMSIDGYYFYVRPRYQRFEIECYSNEISKIE